MSKILAQAGISLADVYDVEGSVAGIEDLLSREVSLVHEMGATIFSERIGAVTLELSSGAKLQNTGWEIDTIILADVVQRIAGITVLAEAVGDISTAVLSIREVGAGNEGREFPIWTWDTIADDEVNVKWSKDGAGVANKLQLRPRGGTAQLPILLPREGTGKLMPRLMFRGATGGFGAGTTETFMLIHMLRPLSGADTPGRPKSRGLPVPSW